jgi:hypothetical protein
MQALLFKNQHLHGTNVPKLDYSDPDLNLFSNTHTGMPFSKGQQSSNFRSDSHSAMRRQTNFTNYTSETNAKLFKTMKHQIMQKISDETYSGAGNQVSFRNGNL